MADASKAEFSRHGNPLYVPNHTPIQLPTHIVDGGLDIKIPEYSSNNAEVLPSDMSLSLAQARGKTSLIPDSTGIGIRPHQNHTDGEVPTSDVCETRHAGDVSEGGMETWEWGNGTRSPPSEQDTKRTKQ